MSTAAEAPAAPNAYRLLWAGFTAILAAGVGYSVRGGILGQWASEFGFTMTELGTITGGGLTGFGVVIILTSLVADRIGYGKLMCLAFVLHLVSALITLATPYAFASGGKALAFECLFWGMFIFAVGNGLAEAVVNPLTATLFPSNKAHFLNILHAGWPAGLVLGGLASATMSEKIGEAGAILQPAVDWKIQMSLFLIPVVAYGLLMLGQRFPKSEAASAGVTMGEMIGTVFMPFMLLLLVVHAMVGYVELGTDSWIAKITGAILQDPQKGLYLFVYTSTLMFLLRFVAGPIVHRISPLGLLLVSAIMGATGLTLLGNAETVVACILAVTVYGFGKTFLWPTMLAVASEQFPKGGAVAIGMLGGVGMLSAGLLGGPAIGFKQDHFASENLKRTSPEAYDRYKAPGENTFPSFAPETMRFKTQGLDGAKVAVLSDGGKELARDLELVSKETAGGQSEQGAKQVRELAAWWEDAKAHATEDKDPVNKAGIEGGKEALKLTAYVPATMAVLYLLMILGFMARGGYKPVHLEGAPAAGH